MKKLPLGIQTFSEIIEKDYLYIDKTKEAYELVESGTKFFFLSRPRRFGKSLFIDTLQELFEGNKKLFEGLYVYDKWEWDVSYPVIKISWGGADFQTLEDLEEKAEAVLEENQQRLKIECTKSRANRCFEELIKKAYEKYNQQVVVLIDEYDKPILNAIENLPQAKINREFIKGMYEVLKENERYIKFGFLTGVSKFSKASIFSGLNMLRDISLNPHYGNICGYTQKDIETSFLPYLDGVDLEKFKNYYNGYNFLKDPVYNPFDTLQFIVNDKIYDNYWFESGTPTYLIKLIKQNNYFLPKLSSLIVDSKLLNSFDIENIDLEVILYQAGYLTIDTMEVDEDLDIIEYKLKIPNKEVKQSLNSFIIETLLKPSNQNQDKKNIIRALKKSDLEQFKEAFISIFASIPYNNYTNNPIQTYEGFYASVVYVYLQSLGLEIIGEDVTNKGRIDLTVKINNLIYIIEFKVGSEDALKQIKEKNYAQKYLNQNKEIYLVGMNFDESEKNIKKFEWEKIKW